MAIYRKWAHHLSVLAGLILLCTTLWYCRALYLSATGDASAALSSQRFNIRHSNGWPVSTLDWQTSPVDLSFLNASEKPAGRRGFVKAAGESLVFGDGTPARFWGANLTANALFGTSRDNVKRQARRMSALGFNLVRIHHFDSPWVSPNVFGKDAADTQTLDPDAMRQIDWWIKCLKDEGIYIWLDLHVERALTAKDNIAGFDEISTNGKSADLKGYNYVNPDIQQAMQRFSAAYLRHVNVYTGVAYLDEPAIMALLITNENDITNHFGNKLLPNRGVPLYSAMYMKLAKEFAATTALPEDKVWRAWEAGAAKIFLNELEYRFNAAMIRHLRGLGAKVPIATTSTWGDNAISSLPALMAGDIIDVHGYGGAYEPDKDPGSEASLLNRLSMGQIAGKPMTVSEWNLSPFPAADRHAGPLYVASAARLQGWDAVMIYAYAQVPLNDGGKPSNWHAYNDPALLATLPAAALLYRQGHVREADTVYALSPDRQQLFYQSNSAANSVAARTAAEKGKLVLVLPETRELPWLRTAPVAAGARVIHNLRQSLLAGHAAAVMSDTGEIRRNWQQGIYTINTPRTQAAMGRLGNASLQLTDIALEIETPDASVAVQSLDMAPVGLSSRLLISLGARALPTGNALPFTAEPVVGQLTIHARKGLRLFKRDGSQQEQEVPVVYRDGKYSIKLDAALQPSWLWLK